MARDDEWMPLAECRLAIDPEVFHPNQRQGVPVDARAAKKYCDVCPVRLHCLAFSLYHHINHGIWGGMTSRQRAAMPRDQKQRLRLMWTRQHPNTKPMRAVAAFLPHRKERKEVNQ